MVLFPSEGWTTLGSNYLTRIGRDAPAESAVRYVLFPLTGDQVPDPDLVGCTSANRLQATYILIPTTT